MLQAVEIETGAGEDVVVIDSHAIGSTAVINGLNIETGAQNDQILIDLSSPGVWRVWMRRKKLDANLLHSPLGERD